MSDLLAAGRRFHFVGIGGIGMSGIAELLLNLGYGVSGSDMQRSEITNRLESLGAVIAQGHAAANVGAADVVVFSSAVQPSNPELAAARERNLRIVPRAEMLAALMETRTSIAIAGAHGKTTTTSMVFQVLEAGGLDPTTVIGGRLRQIDSSARSGHGDYFVAEADESDRSFLKLTPHIAVITNIDREHLEAYRDFDDLLDTFVQFANSVPASGAVVLCIDDPHLKAIRPRIARRVITYGFSADADIRAQNMRSEGLGAVADLIDRGSDRQTELRLSVPGRHNVLNALAAVAVGREIGVPTNDILKGLSHFQGADRRFQIHGEANGVTIVEDYGHHPTEIAAVMAAARPAVTGRLIVAFQPHRYSRTQALMNDFGSAFAGADVVMLTDVYAASEAPIPGVDVEALASAVRRTFAGDVRVVKRLTEMPGAIAAVAKPGDMVVLLGAGSIGSIWRDVINACNSAGR